MTLLNAALILTGAGLFALGVGRAIAWGQHESPLEDTPDRRRTLIRAERETHDRFGW